MQELIKKLFPKGLAVLVIMHLLIIVSIVLVSATLIFYCQDIIKYSVIEAGQFFAAAFALLWGLDIIGGFLGSKLNHKQTIVFGLILLSIGLLIISNGSSGRMFVGLSAVIVGFVLAIPNINLCIAHLYHRDDDKKRSSGFTLSQMGVNIGSMSAALVVGYIVEILGYHTAYCIAAIFPICAILLFLFYFKTFKLKSDSTFLAQAKEPYKAFTTIKLLLMISLAWGGVFLALAYYSIANKLLLSITAIAFIFIFYSATKESVEDRKKLYLLYAIFCVSIVSALSGTLIPSFFAIFIQNHVNRNILGHTFPPEMFQAINAFFIVMLCIPLSIMWVKKSKSHSNFSVFYTLGTGLLLYGVSYLTIGLGLFITKGPKINIFWIILCYFLQALGFLLIAPVTISMIRKLSPIHLEGIILGSFSFANGIAGLLAGVLMVYLNLPVIKNTGYQLTHNIMLNTFGKLSLIPLVFAVFLLLVTFIFNRKKAYLQRETT